MYIFHTVQSMHESGLNLNPFCFAKSKSLTRIVVWSYDKSAVVLLVDDGPIITHLVVCDLRR